MHFKLFGEIHDVQTIATGRGIRERARLQRVYGRGRWRKRKGEANVQLEGGAIRKVELHWYEAHGIGRVEFKIKRFIN